MVYNSVDNNKIKELKKLDNKKYRQELKMFLVNGEHLVEEAYKTNRLKEVYITEGYNKKTFIEPNIIGPKVKKYLSDITSQEDIIGLCTINDNDEIKGNKIIILDNIQDPGNLGTIIRNCVAFDIDTLIISNDTVDMYNSKVIRASQGMIFKLNIIITDLNEVIPKLKEDGYKILTTSVDVGKDIRKVNYNKCAVILGNEGNGVKDAIHTLADDFITINMSDKCESLNVAIAGAIIMYEMRLW